jgi:hypothetical protein
LDAAAGGWISPLVPAAACAGSVASAVRKQFFFVKKNQKTFAT